MDCVKEPTPVLKSSDPRNSFKQEKFNYIRGNSIFNQVNENKRSFLKIKTEYGDFNISVEKAPFPLFGYAMTDKGPERVYFDNFIVLSGVVLKETNARVAIVLHDNNQIDGEIIKDSTIYRFEYYDDGTTQGTFVFRADEIVLKTKGCATDGEAIIGEKGRREINSSGNRMSTSSCSVIDLAAEGDYEFYQMHGGNSWSKIISYINLASTAYYSLTGSPSFPGQLRIQSVHISVWTTSSDPYSSTGNSATLLAEIRSHWNSNNYNIKRDLAYLFTGQELDGGAVLGRAYASVMCSTPSYSYGIVSCENGDTQVCSALVHEIFHNLSSFDAHQLGGPCNIPGYETINCNAIPYNGSVQINNDERNEIANNLYYYTCLRTPAVSPTVNYNPSGSSDILCYNGTLELNYPASSYSWYVDPSYLSGNGSLYAPGGDIAYVTIWDFYRVKGEATDICGNEGGHYFYLYPCSSFARIKVFPNAVDNQITIQLDYLSSERSKLFQFDLYSEDGHKVDLIRNVHKNTNGFQLEIDKVRPKGIYFLHIKSNDLVEKVRLHLE